MKVRMKKAIACAVLAAAFFALGDVHVRGMISMAVRGALEKLRPVAVDVSSGVEVSKGIKDHDRITAFVAAVRAADAANGVI